MAPRHLIPVGGGDSSATIVSPTPPATSSRVGELLFPPGFLWGSATAAHQVEGNQVNDWAPQWEAVPGHIADGSVSGAADDHYHRYPEDIAHLAALGQTAYRFSIEWSRIQPAPGDFDLDALNHYRDVVRCCRAHGIEPVVTLYHFTNPQWFAAQGGVLRRDAAPLFYSYVRRCVEHLGRDVRWWITINEPNIQAVAAYLYGAFPPQGHSIFQTRRALASLMRMHAAGSQAIRTTYRENGWASPPGDDGLPTPAVSFAHHLRPLRADNPRSVADRIVAFLPDYLFNWSFPDVCRDRRIGPPFGLFSPLPAAAIDFVALNYYCDQGVVADLLAIQSFFARAGDTVCVPWGEKPASIARVIGELDRRYRLPILVTENGTFDNAIRSRFILETLEGIHDAIAGGARVLGYIHWTSLDNFEWEFGWSRQYGLTSVDRATMARTDKPSAAVYADICRANRITADLRRRVVSGRGEGPGLGG